MACKGLEGDYRCEGWRTVTARIRKRDGDRCRGCNRNADDFRTEVHHRCYGTPGSCGSCVLTGVTDDDLVLLCVDCHDAITNQRRVIRYGERIVEIVEVPEPKASLGVARPRLEITVDDMPNQATTRIVVRPSVFDIYGKE